MELFRPICCVVIAGICGAVLAEDRVIIRDGFEMPSAGIGVSESVLEVGSGAWTGSLVSDGKGSMQLADPDLPSLIEGISIPLPAFRPGDVVKINARISCGLGVGWIGLGFDDSGTAAKSLMDCTPWAVYRPALGRVAVAEKGAADFQSAYTGKGGLAGLMDVEFIYDTGSQTVTTLLDGAVANNGQEVVFSESPSLSHAFINFYRSGEGVPCFDTYVESFEVVVVQ